MKKIEREKERERKKLRVRKRGSERIIMTGKKLFMVKNSHMKFFYDLFNSLFTLFLSLSIHICISLVSLLRL